MTAATWRIGATTVTRIEEQLGPGSFPPDQYLAGFEREVLLRHLDWLVPNHYVPESDALITSVHSWLIRTPHHNILVDCCSGNHKDRHWWPRFHQLNSPFLERLAQTGVRPEEIDFVMCTHLHADHIGWNTHWRDGRWVPTFPRARYLFSRTEHDFWHPDLNPDGLEDPHRSIAFRDSVQPVLDAGLAQIVEGVHAIDDSLRIEPAPGHTAGHILLQLDEPTGGGIFCGDVIHHPLQVCAPQWNSRFCQDPEQARVTRWRVLSRCAEHGHRLFPTHFGAPHVVAVEPWEQSFLPRFIAPDL